MDSKLKKDIQLYNLYKESYYKGEPIISDLEFDEFEEDLIARGFDPFVGFDDISDSDKVEHRHKMLSLKKYQIVTDNITEEMAKEIFSKYGDGELSWKYDGMAFDLEYTSGVLTGIASRGDGDKGRNLLPKLKEFFPSKLSEKLTINVRGEIVMKNQTFFDKYEGTEYVHPRNLVAGIVRDENVNDPRKLDLSFRLFNAINEESDIVSIPSELKHLEAESFEVSGYTELKKLVDRLQEKRSSFDFPTDGLVYKNGNTEFDHDGKYPDNAASIKFKAPELNSTITGFTWKLSIKTGEYTPTIHFKPIIVDGRSIKKASGHNIEYLIKNDLREGKEVRIVLSNDIIPMIKNL